MLFTQRSQKGRYVCIELEWVRESQVNYITTWSYIEKKGGEWSCLIPLVHPTPSGGGGGIIDTCASRLSITRKSAQSHNLDVKPEHLFPHPLEHLVRWEGKRRERGVKRSSSCCTPRNKHSLPDIHRKRGRTYKKKNRKGAKMKRERETFGRIMWMEQYPDHFFFQIDD